MFPQDSLQRPAFAVFRIFLLASLAGCTPPSPETGIPAPPVGLNDGSPITDFFAYGGSLSFAAEGDSGAVVINGVGANAGSRLVVRSETRVPETDDSAYVRGRIIARLETGVSPSIFGVPPGVGYVWQRLDGTVYRATVIWRSTAPVDSGKTVLPDQAHLSRPGASEQPLVFAFDSIPGVRADTIRGGWCIRCKVGKLKCLPALAMTSVRIDEILRSMGR
jgi:hypothetical protein